MYTSIFIGMPLAAAKSRIMRAFVSPPTLNHSGQHVRFIIVFLADSWFMTTYFDIFRLIASAALSARIRTSIPISSMFSSMMNGKGQLRRTLRHSS